jgi:hypothetical protein
MDAVFGSPFYIPKTPLWKMDYFSQNLSEKGQD